MIDPITAEIVVHAISAIPNLIDKNITQTAFSPLVSEYKDYAVGIVDADGKLITQCKGGIPIFVANALSAAVRDGLEVYGKNELQNGDIVITNHAGTMGQHLNNVVMYTPIRRSEDDEGLFGFMAIVMHWVDVGGIVVGSCLSNETTDVFQEGIQFHTVKLHSRGEPVAEMYRMITANTRFPQMVLGDLEAQIAGCLHGRALVDELLERYGAGQVRAAVERYWDQSEMAVKRAIADIPNGTYEASSFLDNDGVHQDDTVEVNIAVHVADEEITVDLSGIGPEANGPLNAGYEGGAVAASRIACKYFFSPDDPANDGAFRPIKVHCPPGRFLSAGPTAPLSGSGNMLPTVVDTILKALGAAVPEKVPAGHHGTYCLHVITGQLPDGSGWFQHMESAIGGWGASSREDGVGPFRSIVHGDTMEVPVELQEANHPYRIDWVRLRTDSGGAGKHRGGLGIEKCYTMLAPADITAIIERTKCPPWGLDGGREGETGRIEVHRVGGDCSEVLIKGSASLEAGDRALLFSGGGGGHGDPADRETAAVAADVRRGYMSEQAALDDYGWA
ncbi:MAG: hydantoinase B/oxoprolinase family protein [Actinomycetota bacterium]|nr:hydantoinase B/oxoprolinase family protein [Actinomycetota bacterium]